VAANDPKGRFRSSLIDKPQGNADVKHSFEPLVGRDMQNSAAQMMYECLQKKPNRLRLLTGSALYVAAIHGRFVVRVR